jgi:hypothetical protein
MKKLLFVAVLATTARLAFGADISLGAGDSISAALGSANPGDRILLTQDTVPYTIDGVVLDKNITIEGAMGLNPVVAISGVAGEGFRVADNVTANLINFTLDGSANPPAAGIPSLVLRAGSTTVVDRVQFVSASGRAIDGRTLTAPINLTITNSLFNVSGNRMIQLNNIDGGASTIVITDSVFTACSDDAIAIRNAMTSNATIERNIFHTPAGAGPEALQIGGNTGSTFLIRDNVIYNWTDDSIQIESNEGAAYEITRNTFFNVGTAVHVDNVSFSGTITFTQNLIAEWNQATPDGNTARKGYALTDPDNRATWTIANNVVFDSVLDRLTNGTTITLDSSNVTGTDVSGLFESTNPADSNFLRLSPSSAARNVAGSGLDAGAQQLANVSDWLLF